MLEAGDVLVIQYPGEPAFDTEFVIAPDGRVFLPEVGETALAGMTLGEAEARVKDALGDVYRDISRVRVTLTARRMTVMVLGYVAAPGEVVLPRTATLEMAIAAAGGLVSGAQLDRLQLRRDGTVRAFDYKRYLDTGDVSLIPRLVAGDTIFVPSSPLTGNVQAVFDAGALIDSGDAIDDGNGIAVFGEVNRPGTFSFRAKASIIDMLMRAGGVTRYAGVEQIRVVNNGNPVLFNLKHYLDTGDRALLPALRAGDTIFVPQEVEGVRGGARSVHVIGAVTRPGSYETSGDVTILDVLAAAGGPRDDGDIANIRIVSSDEGGMASAVSFDLGAFLEHGGALETLPAISHGDTVMVLRLPNDPTDDKAQWLRQPAERSIYVFGEVGAPGRYAFNERLNFLDILSAAEGPGRNADIRNIRIAHRGGHGARVTRLDLAAYFETGDETLLPIVRPQDVIFVPEIGREWLHDSKESTVRVLGEVSSPGRYRFNDSMTILDLLAEAGGPTSNAYQERIVVVSVTGAEPVAHSFDLVAFARSGDLRALPVVRAGDTVYVPNIDQSPWNVLSAALRDAVSVLSLVALIGAL